MSERKLASIQKVVQTYPIKNADFIELCTVLGWSCIVKKGEVTADELCVYYEIDSFLPKTEMYEFLKKTITHQGKEGYRLRTMKMKKVISQGLVLPFRMFSDDIQSQLQNMQEGDDVTELLDVTKYDIDLADSTKSTTQVTGQPKGKFPSFIPKTDQTRIQSVPHYFDIHKDTLFEETLKLDGSSMTCYKTFTPSPWWKFWSKGSTYFGVCSRNLELTKPKSGEKQSNFWTAAINSNLHNDLPIGYAVQGEVIAPNIQSNYEKVSSVQYHIFNVYSIDAGEYLPPEIAQLFVTNNLPQAQYVPVLGEATAIFQECTSFDDLQDRVTGPSINESQPISEGRVYKSIDGSVTFKCISNAYLLQKGK